MHESMGRGVTPAGGWAALAALVLAAAAGLLLIFYPVYREVSETVSSDGVVTVSGGGATLIQENGAWIVLLLLVPIALVSLGLVGATRGRTLVVWAAAAMLLGFVVLSGLSIGVFYLPTALTLLAAAALTQARRGRGTGGITHGGARSG